MTTRESDKKTKAITIALITLWLLAMLAGGWMLVDHFQDGRPLLTISTFQEHFIDVDGDGRLDFVISADVVLNKSQTVFP
jgi:DNA-binding transcriptional regulator of glucitol operon